MQVGTPCVLRYSTLGTVRMPMCVGANRFWVDLDKQGYKAAGLAKPSKAVA